MPQFFMEGRAPLTRLLVLWVTRQGGGYMGSEGVIPLADGMRFGEGSAFPKRIEEFLHDRVGRLPEIKEGESVGFRLPVWNN